jgi:hypothetical protein
MRHRFLELPELILAFSVLGASVCLSADVQLAQSTDHAAKPSANTNTADFDSLAHTLKGRWTTLVYAGESTSGVPDHGEQVWRTGPGALVLMEEEHVARQGGDMYLMALHWWDRSTNSLKGMLCNNSGSGACNVESYYRSKLNWDGHRLTVDLVFPQGPKMMLWHEEFADFTADSFTQTGDMGEVGGTLKRVLTIHAKRVGDVQN